MHGFRKTGCALALLVLPLGSHAAKPVAVGAEPTFTDRCSEAPE